MGIKIRLGDADRARFGCPEWLEIDLWSVSMRESIQLQKGVLVEGELVAYDSPAAWRHALNGAPVIGDDGQPVTVPVLDDHGDPVLDDDGETPKTVPKRRTDYGAILVLVWLALRRAGLNPTLVDLDFDSDGMRWESIPDPEPVPDAEGKDESSPETIS